MATVGERITELRKQSAMTQSELGEKLSVSPQAVSKWEHDLAEPDISTLSKICKLFSISMDELIGNVTDGTNIKEEETTPKEQPTEPKMIGICTVCGKTVYPFNLGKAAPVMICHDCCKKKEQEEKQRAEAAQQEKHRKAREREQSAHKGLIWSSVITAAVLLFLVILSSNIGLGVGGIIGSIVFSLFVFAVVAQLFWDGVIFDIVSWGFDKTIALPGLIFEFDIDGILWLISMKILFAIISFLFGAFFVTLSFAVALILSPFTFFPALLRVRREGTI